MSLKSALLLFYWQNKSILTRMRYDFGKEIVLLFSSATLLGLFFYIFRDFLTDKLADLPSQGPLAKGMLAAILIAAGPWLGARIHELLHGETSWRQFAHRCGDKPQTIRLFLLMQTAAILFLFYGIFWAYLVPAFPPVSSINLWPWQGLSLILVGLRAGLGSPLRKDLGLKPILNDHPQSRRRTLMSWRWHQLSKRLQVSRLCLGLIAITWLLISILAYLKWPNFLIILLSLFASLLMAAALAFQLEEDMRSIWFERQLGCSHEEYVSIYQSLCLILGLGLGLLVGLPVLIFARESFLAESWKVIPIAALCPLLLPSVMFQLAPERSLLQILVIALMGLFLGTAIYAHSLSLLLVPLVISYAKQYQKDNFYRS